MSAKRLIFVVVRVVIFGILLWFLGKQIHWSDRVTEVVGGKQVVRTGTVIERTRDQIIMRIGDEDRAFERNAIVDRRPTYGIRSILGRLDLSTFGLAFLCMAGTYLVTIIRWHRLCRVRKIDLAFRDAFRLSFIGFFFNNAVPGATGGDVMKAIYAARERSEKADVFASVFVDRIIGLIALVCLAGGVILFHRADEEFTKLANNIFLLLGAIALFGVVYYSRRLRKMLGFSRIAHHLPFQSIFQKLDRAFFLYRYHKSTIAFAFAISVVAHSFTIMSHVLIGDALGLEIPLVTYLIYIPIGQVASALPIAPGGWGVREAMYGYMFQRAGFLFSYGTAIGLLHGLIVLIWSLFGGLLFLLGNERLQTEPVDFLDDDVVDAGATP